MSKLIVHQNFEGEHEPSEACWCRPLEIEADDLRDAADIAQEVEATNG